MGLLLKEKVGEAVEVVLGSAGGVGGEIDVVADGGAGEGDDAAEEEKEKEREGVAESVPEEENRSEEVEESLGGVLLGIQQPDVAQHEPHGAEQVQQRLRPLRLVPFISSLALALGSAAHQHRSKHGLGCQREMEMMTMREYKMMMVKDSEDERV